MIAQVIHSSGGEKRRFGAPVELEESSAPSDSELTRAATGRASDDADDDGDGDPPLGDIDVAALLDDLDDGDADDPEAHEGIDVQVTLEQPHDGAEDEHHRIDFDAASLLSVDESRFDDDDSAIDAGAIDVGVAKEHDPVADEDAPREALDWFTPDLPPMDGSTDGEAELPLDEAGTTFSGEAATLAWADARYEARVLQSGPLPLRCMALHGGRVLLAGSELARLVETRDGARIERLHDEVTLPNPIVSLSCVQGGVVACPAGPRLSLWSESESPRSLPWPATRAQSRGPHRTRLHADGNRRCWMVTPSGRLLSSADGASTWNDEPPRDVLRIAGTGPVFVACTSNHALRVWAQDSDDATWKRLPLEASVAKFSHASVLLAAQEERVALYTPGDGLKVSSSGGLDFHRVPGIQDLLGLAYDARGTLLAVQASPSSDGVSVLRIEADSRTAVRVAEISGPREEEPELDALLAVESSIYALGNFGLVRLRPEPPGK